MCVSFRWSRTGRKLLSASTDNNVSLWDTLTGECDQRFRFPSPVLKVQFHPRNENLVLVCPMKHAPVVVNVLDNTHKIVPLDKEEASDAQVVASYDSRGNHIFVGNAKGKVTVLTSGTSGKVVKAAAKEGADADDEKPKEQLEEMKTISSFRVTQQISSTTAIKSIEFSRRGKSFLVNTADRVIRVYRVSEVMNLKGSHRKMCLRFTDQ